MYRDYMANGNLSNETMERVIHHLNSPAATADEWKQECIAMLDHIHELKKKINELSAK
jgi:hypothetical protein